MNFPEMKRNGFSFIDLYSPRIWAGEMTWVIKFLPRNHENLNCTPSTHKKNPGAGLHTLVTPINDREAEIGESSQSRQSNELHVP